MGSGKKSECEAADSSKRICRHVLPVPFGSGLQPELEQREDKVCRAVIKPTRKAVGRDQDSTQPGNPLRGASFSRLDFGLPIWRTDLSCRRRRVSTIKSGYARHPGHDMDKLPLNVHVLIIDDFSGGVGLSCTG